MTKVLSFFVVFLLCGSASGLAQMRNQKVSTENVNSPASSWDTSLPGKWTYRSYRNRAGGQGLRLLLESRHLGWPSC